MTVVGGDDEEYLETLFGIIDRTLRDFYPLPSRVGELTQPEARREYTEDGVFAVSEFGLSHAPGRRFRYRRRVLGPGRPDKDPETTAVTYTVSLMERLVTRPLPHPGDPGPLTPV